MLKKERYNLMLNPRVVGMIDKLAEREDLSRSEYVNKLFIEHCRERKDYMVMSFGINPEIELIKDLEVS